MTPGINWSKLVLHLFHSGTIYFILKPISARTCTRILRYKRTNHPSWRSLSHTILIGWSYTYWQNSTNWTNIQPIVNTRLGLRQLGGFFLLSVFVLGHVRKLSRGVTFGQMWARLTTKIRETLDFLSPDLISNWLTENWC